MKIPWRSGRMCEVRHHVGVAGDVVLVAVNGTDRVAVVSRAGRMARSIPVGAGPHGIAAAPAR